MKMKIDKQKARRAQVLAFHVDDLKGELIGRLDPADEKVLDKATKLLYRISKGVIEVVL